MEAEQIVTLLKPYVAQALAASRLDEISTYVNILLRWNQRTNLTSIRDEAEIVRRHFGESLFAASRLIAPDTSITAIDVGSGAGFPGLPLRIFAPDLRLTLIESHGMKATFLREVVRALGWKGVTVLEKRAERVEAKGDLVTFRAVENFDSILKIAAGLVGESGRLGMLVGAQQIEQAKRLLPGVWEEPIVIPGSVARVLAVWRAER